MSSRGKKKKLQRQIREQEAERHRQHMASVNAHFAELIEYTKINGIPDFAKERRTEIADA